jgi:hypothetical protein
VYKLEHGFGGQCSGVNHAFNRKECSKRLLSQFIHGALKRVIETELDA